MSWWEYVRATAASDDQASIARRLGVSQPTVSRWKKGAPDVQTAAKFARAYGRPVLEAFVAAGFLTLEEAGVVPAPAPEVEDSVLDYFDDLTLLETLQDRQAWRERITLELEDAKAGNLLDSDQVAWLTGLLRRQPAVVAMTLKRLGVLADDDAVNAHAAPRDQADDEGKGGPTVGDEGPPATVTELPRPSRPTGVQTHAARKRPRRRPETPDDGTS